MLMDDIEFEEILTAALYRASELDTENAPSDAELDNLVQPSPRFQRKIRALLRNPNVYARNQRRPVYFRVMRVAAVIFIVLTVMFTATIAISPTVRAAVVTFVRTWLEDRTEYYVPHSNLNQDWTVGYIPEGFELIEEVYHFLQIELVYGNDENMEIYINISTGNQIVDNEHSDFYNTIINGNIADVYVSNDEDAPNIIVMIQDLTGVLITFVSELDISELLKIAENIS